MRLFDRHLVVLLGLVALTGIALALPRLADDSDAAGLRLPPPVVDGWIATDSVPEDVLPLDSRAREAARWTYSREGHAVFVSVACYRSSNDPEWRPSINQIAPERGAISVDHARLALSLDGVADGPVTVSRLSVRRPNRELSILYWYQVRGKTIEDGLQLRLALLASALRLRGQDVWLVRIATPAPGRPEEFAREFYPQLVKALSR
jgi:EpsI family protein